MATFHLKPNEVNNIPISEYTEMARYAAIYSPRMVIEMLGRLNYLTVAQYAKHKPNINKFIPNINEGVKSSIIEDFFNEQF